MLCFARNSPGQGEGDKAEAGEKGHQHPHGQDAGGHRLPRYIWSFRMSIAQKKDKDRTKGKGRRVCLGDRIYSYPCHARYFVLGQF